MGNNEIPSINLARPDVAFHNHDVLVQRVAASYAIRRYIGNWTMGSTTSDENVRKFLEENDMSKMYTFSDDALEGIYRS